MLTLHRPSNVDDGAVLAGLLDAVERIQREMPVVLPVHPRLRAALERFGLDARLAALPGVRATDPLGYLDCLKLIASAAVCLTDSGGVQEETTALGVPCLTLRENTERPVTVEAGTNRVVGRDPDRIVAAFRDAVSRPRPSSGPTPRLWDGEAGGGAIAAVLEARLPLLAGRRCAGDEDRVGPKAQHLDAVLEARRPCAGRRGPAAGADSDGRDDMPNALIGMVAALVACAVCAAAAPAAARAGRRWRLVDEPDDRKRHAAAVPCTGGAAVMLGFAAACLAAFWLGAFDAAEDRPGSTLVAATAIVFAVGLLEDARGCPIALRLLMQSAAAGLVVAAGYPITAISTPVGTVEFGEAAGSVLAVVWLVGITNAINLMDGLDGLAGGVASIIAGQPRRLRGGPGRPRVDRGLGGAVRGVRRLPAVELAAGQAVPWRQRRVDRRVRAGVAVADRVAQGEHRGGGVRAPAGARGARHRPPLLVMGRPLRRSRSL